LGGQGAAQADLAEIAGGGRVAQQHHLGALGPAQAAFQGPGAHGANRLPIDLPDHIAGLDARRGRGRARTHREDLRVETALDDLHAQTRGAGIRQAQILGAEVGVQGMGPLQGGHDAAADDLLHVRTVHIVLAHQAQHILDVRKARQGVGIAGLGLLPGRLPGEAEVVRHHGPGEDRHHGQGDEGEPGALVHPDSVSPGSGVEVAAKGPGGFQHLRQGLAGPGAEGRGARNSLWPRLGFAQA